MVTVRSPPVTVWTLVTGVGVHVLLSLLVPLDEVVVEVVDGVDGVVDDVVGWVDDVEAGLEVDGAAED